MDVQLERLADQQFVEAAVLAQDERIVQAGYQQNIVHAEGHQVLEALEEVFGLGCGVVCWSCGGYHLPFSLEPVYATASWLEQLWPLKVSHTPGALAEALARREEHMPAIAGS